MKYPLKYRDDTEVVPPVIGHDPLEGRAPSRPRLGFWIAPILYSIVLLFVAGCSPSPDRDPPALDTQPSSETDDRSVILFLGDSLTAGYYLDPEDAFPALIQQKLDTHGYEYRAVNAGVSGDTSLDGLNRLDWVLRQEVSVLVLALGANDALRGQPVERIRENLDEIMSRTRERYADVRFVLGGMRMPVNYGEPYISDFEQMFRGLADKHDAVLIPFLLEGVAGDPVLNLRDGIHPTEEGHAIMAETVWRYLERVL